MSGILRTLVFLFIAIGMFYYPQEVIASASNGINLWWRFVLPALLPFFIISELLMKQGFVHFLGVLLEPLMRPLFRLPGKASFIIAMAYTSGIPIGAILTSKLREQNELTREEGERLLAFTSNPSPGFMFGAVATGMLGKPGLGIIIAGSVYIANLLVGIIFRFYRPTPQSDARFVKPSFKRALREMEKAQKEDARPIGILLGDSVSHSITTILAVGGFITFFSVVIHMLQVLNVTTVLTHLLEPLFGAFLPLSAINALIIGLFETTIGCQESVTAFSSINGQVGMLALILGWGGLSVFAQVASFTSKTDLRFSAFLVGRTLHGLLALLISQLLLIFTNIPTSQAAPILITNSEYWWNTWRLSSQFFVYTTLALVTFSLVIYVWQRLIRRS